MSKRYKRHYSRRNSKGPNALGLLLIVAIVVLQKYWKLIIAVAVAAVGIFLIYKFLLKDKKSRMEEIAVQDDLDIKKDSNLDSLAQATYTAKDSIMTASEHAFFNAIKGIVEPRYTIQPQINLASVIEKESFSRYRNELFRNIDFGIFDDMYRLVLLVEINDQTHMDQKRKARDQRVKDICKEANIPLVTFWTQYGVNKEYIKKRLSEYLKLEQNNENVRKDII